MFIINVNCICCKKGKDKTVFLPKISGVEVTPSVILVESSEQFWRKIRQIWRILRTLFSWESWCLPEVKSRETSDSRENKTNWFPEGPDIKCFVIFLDFHFNSNERITGANQNSPLDTYNNTNLILKTTKMKDLQSTFLILSATFSSTRCCFSSGIDFKNRCFLAWGFVFVLLCSFTKKKTGWESLGI